MATRSLMRSRYLLYLSQGGIPATLFGRGVSCVLRRARRTRRVSRTLSGGKGGGGAESLGDRAQHLHRDIAVLVEHVAELLVSEDQATHRCGRPDGRRPRAVVDESDLAEEVARAESALAPVGIHLGLPLKDDEEVAAALALLGEHATGRDVHLVGTRGDEHELFVGAAGEERHRTQPIDAWVGHRAEFSSARRSACLPRTPPR